MKKIFNWLIALPALFLLGACAQEEIVFDHEKPAFETKDGQILLEVIVPSSTKADDVIYIAGAFNGGDEVAAENTMWHLEKSTEIDKKWGIYLDPTTFVEGKTLADGYHFVSVREGEERTALNEAVNRTESPAVGSRTNIYVSYWNMYFYVVPEIEHDGHVIYIQDNTGWENFRLYAWGTELPELFGGWPGAAPTGTEVIDGVTYLYFDTGASNEGLTYNLIFNNKVDGASDTPTQYDVEAIVLDKDYFYVANADSWDKANSLPSHDGTIRVYLDNQAGWKTANLYMYGTVNDLGEKWPGLPVTGTATIAGVEYMYFEYEVDLVVGNEEHLIFNDGSKQIPTAQEPVITFTTEVVDYFYVVYADLTCVAVDPFDRQPAPDPGTGDEGGEDEGEGGEGTDPEADPVYVYVADQTGWKTGAHYWNAAGFSTAWPGLWLSEQTSKSLSGVEYKVFQVDPAAGAAVSIIFHNDQSNDVRLQKDLTTDKTRYYTLTATELTETQPKARIYVDDQTGWDAIAVYAYEGDYKIFGDWPGATVTGTETVDGKTYKYFEVSHEDLGRKVNVIFNNNGAGTQIENKPDQVNLVLDQDYFYTVTADDAVFVE